jgi:hypothetical protein
VQSWGGCTRILRQFFFAVGKPHLPRDAKLTGEELGHPLENFRLFVDIFAFTSLIIRQAKRMRRGKIAPKSFDLSHPCPACGYKIEPFEIVHVTAPISGVRSVGRKRLVTPRNPSCIEEKTQ